MTSQPRVCRNCQHPIAESVLGDECPVCLFRLAFPSGEASDAPPSLAELRAHFPEMEVLALIGTGGMASVYQIRSKDLGRTAAMKVLSAKRTDDPQATERFLRESQALALFSHPNIVAVYQFGRTDRFAFLLMEYVNGGSLRERLMKGRMSPPEAFSIIHQICDALQYAHDRGVIHRDIKPENILLDEQGQVKVADFGLAKVADANQFTLTDDGMRMGTARYMAPEQWANSNSVDHRADLYSLGVLFYELLTGDLPGPHSKPPSQKVGTDPRLDKVVSKTLQEAPDERYQQATDIKTDVVRISSTSPVPKRILTGVLATLILSVLVATIWRSSKPDPGLPTPFPAVKSEIPSLPPTPTEILTSPAWEWTPPENLGPQINTEHNEGSPFLTADGCVLLFQSNRPGGLGDLDLWQARRAAPEQPFGEPTNLGEGVNSRGVEGSPCLSADGCTLVFHSNRRGRFDIFLVRRTNVDTPWGRPALLPRGVRSPTIELRPWLSPDGLTLTFVSFREHPDELWIARRPSLEAEFEPPVPFGRDSYRKYLGGPSFSADGQIVLLNRLNRYYHGNLLWLGRVTSRDEAFDQLTSFGPVVNSPWIDMDPVAATDGRSVLFQSDRPGGLGGSDIWLTRRVPKK